MDTPENYYAVLGVSADADSDTLKRAYRQLARRFHPDLAGPEGAIQMKRINRAYAILGDEEKRQQYDTILGGVVDMRRRGYTRPHSRVRAREELEDVEFSGLNTFSTRGPLRAGPVLKSSLGVTSALSCVLTAQGLFIAAGSLDGKGIIWQVAHGETHQVASIANDPSITVESLRSLRFSNAGTLLAGWHRLGLHVWDVFSGELLWSLPVYDRAVSAHYSLDATLHSTPTNERIIRMALPYLAEDGRSPRAWGVRSTDVASHYLNKPDSSFSDINICPEESVESRLFWAIRMRALSDDGHTLVTLSCAQVANEQQEMVVVRRWKLAGKSRLLSGTKAPQVELSVLLGSCADCTPPYAATKDTSMVAFVYSGDKIRLCDTRSGVYNEISSGTMGGSSRMAISADGQWLAVAREDSEDNEGVIDLWSINTNQIVQKFYHPWQVSALHFADHQLIAALTDGTIQIWQ